MALDELICLSLSAMTVLPDCDTITNIHDCTRSLFAFLRLDRMNLNFDDVHMQRTESAQYDELMHCQSLSPS